MASRDDKLIAELDAHRKRVDVDHYDLTVRELLRMVEEGELKRAPEYQRRFRWDSRDESRFIESVFLGLPIPSIFVATNTDGTWELVDGLQRVSTLADFMTESKLIRSEIHRPNPLILDELEKLTTFNGLAFSDLPTPQRLQFGKRALRVTALSDKSDPEVRFDTFERLNRGGVALTAQEVRACVFRGPFSDLLRELGESGEFKSLVKLQQLHEHDATREELVLKFFAYLDRQDEFDGRVTDFLNRYMREEGPSFDLDYGRSLFLQVIQTLGSFLKGPILRSGYGVTPQNQLEAILVATGKLIKQKKRVRKPKAGWLDDDELVEYSTKGTNTKKSFNGRIDRALVLLSGK